MNSTDERAIFEQHGWRYDQIARCYVSPDGGTRVSTDDLVTAADVLGPGVERRVREIAAKFGVRR